MLRRRRFHGLQNDWKLKSLCSYLLRNCVVKCQGLLISRLLTMIRILYSVASIHKFWRVFCTTFWIKKYSVQINGPIWIRTYTTNSISWDLALLWIWQNWADLNESPTLALITLISVGGWIWGDNLLHLLQQLPLPSHRHPRLLLCSAGRGLSNNFYSSVRFFLQCCGSKYYIKFGSGSKILA